MASYYKTDQPDTAERLPRSTMCRGGCGDICVDGETEQIIDPTQLECVVPEGEFVCEMKCLLELALKLRYHFGFSSAILSDAIILLFSAGSPIY